MTNNLERRIRLLESRLSPKYIELEMANGRKHRIRGGGEHLLRLFRDAASQRYSRSVGEPVPPSQYPAELALIKESVNDNASEMGCGQMVGLVRMLMNSPAGDIEANRLDEAQGGDIGDGEE